MVINHLRENNQDDREKLGQEFVMLYVVLNINRVKSFS